MEVKRRIYTDAEKLGIIMEYMNSGESMEKFQTKKMMGHCTISRWMTKFGLSKTSHKQFEEMGKKTEVSEDKSQRELILEAKLAQLEKELKDERMKTLAYKTLIDTAEEELGIDLRKKSGAKQ